MNFWQLTSFYEQNGIKLFIFFVDIFASVLGDSTDQEYEITADMMVHDIDDETTMDEEELMADKDEFNEDELSALQKVKKKSFYPNSLPKTFSVFWETEFLSCVLILDRGKNEKTAFFLHFFTF